MSSVVVVGDVMLDVFEEGHVERISPEAPVPVLHNPKGYEVLGGAANTALNIHSLGLPATLIGLVGDDDAGRRCQELVSIHGLSNGLIEIPGWSTVVKHRFMAGGQQILRVDTEEPATGESARGLLTVLVKHLEQATALVLSDYDKGAVTDEVATSAVRIAHDRQIPVIVDSKRRDPSPFRGCTVIAPNRMEAERMAGTSDPLEAAQRIQGITDSAVLVTLGPDGMLLLDQGIAEHIHSRAREVADVTGAGDSVSAGLAVALVEGKGLADVAKFAGAVAAAAVEHRGTYAVTRRDLRSDDLH